MSHSRRRFFTHAATLAAAPLLLPSTLTAAPDEPALQWADVRDWGVEGRAFNDTEAWFDRLPGRAKGVVRDSVWNLSRHSAGMLVHFRTDATQIHVDYAVTSETLAMPHMPATGVSGLDLYGRTLSVAFVQRLRDEQRFADLDALTQQITADVAQASRLFDKLSV